MFINKNKPKERENKVLMIYAGKKGWYREEPNMNVLEPHDLMRISTILESWGDVSIAEKWMDEQKKRLFARIQADLDFEISEIEEEFLENLQSKQIRLSESVEKIESKQKAGKNPTKNELMNEEKARSAFEKVVAERAERMNVATIQAQKKRDAIEMVEEELLKVLQTPELAKRYFSVVDMDEIEENEFNLNIPRYVDTFEPEEQIDLKFAIADFHGALDVEKKCDKELDKLLSALE